MQDTVNFNSIAGICKIHAAIKNLMKNLPRFPIKEIQNLLWGPGENFGLILSPHPAKIPL
ncbi:hypothetical protein BGV40_07055 [Methanosarcina sp. Ant1]|nr:hypothetical protein BGV40_07055 [Methanosarcina sp. Ant1]